MIISLMGNCSISKMQNTAVRRAPSRKFAASKTLIEQIAPALDHKVHKEISDIFIILINFKKPKL
jgi:hypothetical protein